MSTWLFWLAVGAFAVSARINCLLFVIWWRTRKALRAERAGTQTLREELGAAHATERQLNEQAHGEVVRSLEEAHAAALAGVLRELDDERRRSAEALERAIEDTLHQVRLAHRESYDYGRFVGKIQKEWDRKEFERERWEKLSLAVQTKEALALALMSERRYAEALRAFYEVYGLAHQSGCPATVASALHNIALVTARLGDVEGAVALIKEAIALSRGHQHGAECLTFSTGVAHSPDQRVEMYEQHLRVFIDVLATRKAKARQQEALALLNEGKVDDAVSAFRAAARIAEEGNNPHLKVSNLINCANALAASDQAEKALVALAEARLEAEKLGPEAEFLRTLISTSTMSMENISMTQVFRNHMARVRERGAVQDYAGAESAARDAFAEACRKFGPRHYLAAVALDSIAVSLTYLGEHTRALEIFERAVDVAGEWEEKAGGILATARTHLDVCRELTGYPERTTDVIDEFWRPDDDSAEQPEWRPGSDE
jgi:tetratricopeptide (TPR) repeat protein